MKRIIVEQCENGYITDEAGFGNKRRVFRELDEVFAEMLSGFEGRYKSYKGDRYGDVVIFRVKKQSDAVAVEEKRQEGEEPATQRSEPGVPDAKR